MKKILLIIVLNISFVNAQDLDLLLLGKNDANLLIENYINPIMDGMSFGINNGWYHTAKTHKKFGFDITISASAAVTASSDKTFQFNNANYDYLSVVNGSSTIQTVMGSENNTTIEVRIPEGNNYKVAEFAMPDGIGDDLPLNATPSAMIQASLGLPFDTDVIVRYVPTVDTDDVNANLFGIGFKHNLMQYLGPLDKLPLNLAILAGFTNINSTYYINENEGLSGSNQQLEFSLNTITIQAIGSLDFPIISLYAGIGYDRGSSSIDFKGTYELEYTLEGTNTTIQESITNPLNMDFSASSFRGTLGARLNLGFFKIFGDYSIKKYHTITTGIAFSFR